MLSNFLRGGKNPANAAMPFFEKIPSMERDIYNPFIDRGKEAGDMLSAKFRELLGDPSGFLETLMEDYEPSRGYQLQRDEALRAAGNTAAAGGQKGSLQDIEQQARITDMLMGDDMQRWLSNVTGLFGAGLTGEKGFFDTGFNASGNLASDLGNIYSTQGQLAFQGQREKNQRVGDLLQALLQGAGGIAGLSLPGKDAGTVGGALLSKFI